MNSVFGTKMFLVLGSNSTPISLSFFPWRKTLDIGRDPFNQTFRKFRSKTQRIGSVQPEKFRKNGSTFWGGPLFPVGPVGILVEWIAPIDMNDSRPKKKRWDQISFNRPLARSVDSWPHNDQITLRPKRCGSSGIFSYEVAIACEKITLL